LQGRCLSENDRRDCDIVGTGVREASM